MCGPSERTSIAAPSINSSRNVARNQPSPSAGKSRLTRQWLEATQECRQPAAVGGDQNGRASRPPRPSLARSPIRGADRAGVVALEELKPAARPPDRVHGDAGARQRIDVAHHGPLRDLEALGELGRRGATSLLKDQHKVQEPARAHRGNFDVPAHA